MSTDRLITVAIHTYEKAVMLRTLLENEGVPVVLNNVNLEQPVVSSGVRVRIKEKDLPLALRIIENADIFTANDTSITTRQQVVVPIDFAEYSMKAVIAAFNIAKANKTSVIFLHSFIDPYFNSSIPLSEHLSYDSDKNDYRKTLESETEAKMKQFIKVVKEKIKQGEIPAVKFSTAIREGVAEDVIVEYTKQAMPMLIVMATRMAEKKEKELIGSVTAEVMDSCRFPVYSIPENTHESIIEQPKNILFICNVDQDDIIAIDSLSRLMPNGNAHITLLHIHDKKRNIGNKNAYNALHEYCNVNYPMFTYSTQEVKPGKILSDMNFADDDKPHLVVLPSKRKNIFTRLFNPSIAHKVLFNTDIPLMVIPV